MILGIGIDLVQVSGMEHSLQSAAFLDKVFTQAELKDCDSFKNKAERLAGKFAAKEAFMKAIGAGLRQDVWFKQIEVLSDEAGKPYIQTSGEAGKRFSQSGAREVHLSISHSAGVAVAVVILDG